MLPHLPESYKSQRSAAHLILHQAIQHLLDTGAIEPVSEVFIVPKKNGDVRAIVDLKWLNCGKRKFWIETLRSKTSSVQKEDFMVSIDLSETYLHILIWEFTEGSSASCTMGATFNTQLALLFSGQCHECL